MRKNVGEERAVPLKSPMATRSGCRVMLSGWDGSPSSVGNGRQKRQPLARK